MTKRKICVVTGSRAEYGLLYWVLLGLRDDPEVELQLCVTGMHLSSKHGLTYKNIETDGFHIDKKIDSQLDSDTAVAVSQATGQTMIGFAQAIDDLQPDLILVVGDRFEIFGAVSAAAIANIPVAHCHGGELTLGAFDDSLRHAITKMSHIHFSATQEYKNRILQLGEDPNLVFVTGALGIENIRKLSLLDRQSLEEKIDFQLGKRNLLVTFHPSTREKESSGSQIEALLAALDRLEGTHFIFTKPNADTDSLSIHEQIDAFVESRKEKAVAITSMGTLNYLSALQFVDGVVGNSSSGLIEAPSFKIGTVNIGSRQDGRIRASSVIDCEPQREAISKALNRLYDKGFTERLKKVENPYDHGNASEKILPLIKKADLDAMRSKGFFDLPTNHHG